MNKYSQKIMSLLDTHFKSHYNYINYDNESIIIKMIKIFDHISSKQNDTMNIILNENIPKLHDVNQQSLIHIAILKLFRENILQKYHECDTNIADLNCFIEWFKKNETSINLKKMISQIKDNNLKQILFHPNKNRQFLHELLYENSFIPYYVIHGAESIDLQYIHYNGNNCDIYVYQPKYDVNTTNFNVELVSKIISFMRTLFNREDLHVKLIVLLSKQKKHLPCENENKFFSPENVNSGATVREDNIMIWREEEFYKVLIHELIHYFGIDFYITDPIYKRIDNIFKNNFIIDGIDRVNEAYTEILALTIHSVIYGVLHKKQFSEIIAYEKLFSQYQVAKILECMNIFKFEDLTSKKIIQSTSVCSYYIIKCIFLLNINIFLNYWTKHGYFINDKTNNSFFEIYQQIANIRSINTKIINDMISFINQNKNENSFVFTTMRMTMFQLF